MATLNVEVQAQVNQAVRDLGRVSKGFDLMGKANQDAAGALGAFGISLTQFSNPLTLVASTIKSSIDFTSKWGDTIDELTRVTGTSARESSKLAIVLGDVGISTDSLRGAAKALKDQGLTPSLDTLKELAKQYQAIQDPAKRTEWGTKTLGRAYFELSEVLTKTPAQFDELSRAAEKSGKIIGEDAVQAAEDFDIQLRQLQDRADGLKLKLGSALIPVLSDAADGFDNLTQLTGALWIKTQQMTGAITDEEAAIQAEILATGGLHTAFDEIFDDRAEAIAQSRDHTGLVGDEKAAEEELDAVKELSNSIYDLATAAIRDSNIGLAQQIELTEALALASGKMTVEELAQKDAIGFLTKQLELGKITMNEYKAAVDNLASGAASARDVVNQVGAAINGLPSSKDIYINVHSPGAGEAGIGPTAPIPAGPPDVNTGGDKFQHGGSFIIPPGYNESFPIGPRGVASSGERVTVAPAGGTGGEMNYQALMMQMESRLTRAFRDALLMARS